MLGNAFRVIKLHQTFTTREEAFQNYPLPEVWETWYQKWAFEPRDLVLLVMSMRNSDRALDRQLPNKCEFVPEKYWEKIHYWNAPLVGIFGALTGLHPMENSDAFFVQATVRLFSSLSEEVRKAEPNKNYITPNGYGWQQGTDVHVFINRVNLGAMDKALIPLYWNLFNWRQYSGRENNILNSIPPLLLFCRAYKIGTINQHDVYRSLLTADNIRLLSGQIRHARDFDYFEHFDFLKPMFDTVRDHILDIELKRGDSPTAVSSLAVQLGRIHGVKRLTQVMAGMGKTSLQKGYFYGWSSSYDKQTVFSNLLKNCHALESDAQEAFDASMERIKATEQRLIEMAMFAPQWQGYVSKNLGWKGLDNAIWWMHAHTKTDGYRAQNAEAESEIARYSTLDVQEFKDGAVDKDWFLKAYKEIGKERWPLVYEAAKYITDGNGHRRARIYSDVLIGNLSLKEVTEKIASKRDQDYVRIYGLAPLNKSNPQKDILARYEFIQEFKKGSRQFGAQKQASEAAAVQVAMDNLARNAGYPDPIRLTWAMETKQVQTILAKETQVQFDDVVIGLIIDEEGEADVVAFQGGKSTQGHPRQIQKGRKSGGTPWLQKGPQGAIPKIQKGTGRGHGPGRCVFTA